jgi:hypothetical protein
LTVLPQSRGTHFVRWPDGSTATFNSVLGKWEGRWADGTPLRGEGADGLEDLSAFDSAEAVGLALFDGGEGPASMFEVPVSPRFDWDAATPMTRDAAVAALVMGEPLPTYPNPEPLHSSRTGKSACGCWYYHRGRDEWVPAPFTTYIGQDDRVRRRALGLPGPWVSVFSGTLQRLWVARLRSGPQDVRRKVWIANALSLVYEPGDYARAAILTIAAHNEQRFPE